MKVAAIGDLHVRTDTASELGQVFKEAAEEAEILLLVGDLTDEGKPEEAEILRELLETVKIPVIGVLGNHDYESGQEDEVKQILESEWLTLLDGDAVEKDGVGFAGVKGFGGGFENHMLPNYGEKVIKDFVKESVDEMLKLEKALSKLESKETVVLMHYAPIPNTLKGESEELWPFLGVSRLEFPVNRFGASVVFHGHAHHGVYKGETTLGIPVYNVARSVLQKDKKEYALVEIGKK